MEDIKKEDPGTRPGLQKRVWFLVMGVVMVVASIVAVAFYMNRVAPFRTTILLVDGVGVDMRTFIRRCYISGEEPLSMFKVLLEEQIIHQVAPFPPYEIQVTRADIDAYLRTVARGNSVAITENDFNEWYRQNINESRLSEDEFLNMVQTRLLKQGLADYLAERVSTVAEQVHVMMITVKSIEAASSVRERLLKGEDFTAVAKDVSSEEWLRLSGGNIGWLPRGTMLPHIEEVVFDELTVGEISEPLYLDDQLLAVVVVREHVAARDIEESMRKRLQNRALQDWLEVEKANHKVEFFGLSGAYDAETDAWVKWQLARMKQLD